MGQVDITWLQALKNPVEFLLAGMSAYFAGAGPAGDPPVLVHVHDESFPEAGRHPSEVARMAGTMAVAWHIVMSALQAQAMRWMLNKGRWSDFRVAVLPLDQ